MGDGKWEEGFTLAWLEVGLGGRSTEANPLTVL